MQLSVVNKKGFASLYVLAIVQLISAFSLLLLSISRCVLVSVQASEEIHHAQLFSLYHIKARLEQGELNDEGSDEESTLHSSFSIEEETYVYQNVPIHFTYHINLVEVSMEAVTFQVMVDAQNKCILALVYL